MEMGYSFNINVIRYLWQRCKWEESNEFADDGKCEKVRGAKSDKKKKKIIKKIEASLRGFERAAATKMGDTHIEGT